MTGMERPTFSDQGIDSLDVVEIILAIEERFVREGVWLDEDELEGLAGVDDLLDVTRNKLGQHAPEDLDEQIGGIVREILGDDDDGEDGGASMREPLKPLPGGSGLAQVVIFPVPPTD